MNKIILLLLLIIEKPLINCLNDLIPEAITVYRNPEFFKKLDYSNYYTTNNNNNQKKDRYYYYSKGEKNFFFPND